MTVFDFINGFFELGAGVVMLLNSRTLYRDKQLKGYSIWATVFFTIWGFWNMVWYPSLDAWASFAGGLLIVFANLLWIGLALHYRRPMLLAQEVRCVGGQLGNCYRRPPCAAGSRCAEKEAL